MTPEALQREIWAPERSAQLAAQIARSNARYLSLAAGLTPLRGAVLAAVEGLTRLPAGCAVIVLDGVAAALDARDWVRSAEAAARRHGAGTARVYLDVPAPPLERELLALGFQRRIHDVLLTPPGPAPDGEELHLVPVEGPLWEVARDLQPAGRRWELMRRKQEAGGLECYLLESGRRLRGSVGIVPMPDVLTITDLVVHPDDRREGVGRAAVRAVWHAAVERGRSAAGLIAPRGTSCTALGESAGCRPAGAIVEWSRTLIRP